MLNEELYDGLTLAIRKGRIHGNLPVKVKNEGQDMICRYVQSPLKPTGQKDLQIHSWGETYQICCPFCGDTRYRVDISHRWNLYDPIVKSKNLNLIKCYNEDCFSDFENIKELQEMIEVNVGNLKTKTRIRFGNSTRDQLEAVENLEVELPPHRDLGMLPDTHPAARFLTERGHNYRKLARYFNLGWIEHHYNPQVDHRILVPFIGESGAINVGAQCRFIDKNGGGTVDNLYHCANNLCRYQFFHYDDIKPKACPKCGHNEEAPNKIVKWYTLPGTKKSHTLYNIHNAKTWGFGVVMEGPADVWSLGNMDSKDMPGPGMAVFGHHISAPYQTGLLTKYFKTYNKPIFLIFDSDVYEKTVKDHIETLRYTYGGRVVPVKLPDDTDPGDLSHRDLWSLIIVTARKEHVRVPEFSGL